MRIIDLRRIKPPDEVGSIRKRLLWPVLAPLSLVYGGAMWIWRRSPAHCADPKIPVISVGSLGVGGTGKTPLCMLVAGRFRDSGRKTCIISRGYRRRQKESPLIVSDGSGVLVPVEAAGDEPYMMAQRLRGVGVIVGKDRARAAAHAKERLGADTLVLDDGFQCRNIRKHVEIVCLDANTLSRRAATLPLGPLRERLAAVRFSHVVVVVRSPGDPEPDAEDLARLASQRLFFAARRCIDFIGSDGNPVATDDIGKRGNLLVSGIARPEAFEKGCVNGGANVVASVRFEDHHWYGKPDVERIVKFMEIHGCTHLITTEKDLYKLPSELRGVAAFLRMELGLEDEENFLDALDDLLEAASCP